MARPKAKELTERELEIMHVFWDRGVLTANQVRLLMAELGQELAYTTLATLPPPRPIFDCSTAHGEPEA